MRGPTLKGRRVLVTAGPTWVAIDRVRVISSIFGGRMGVAIGREAARQGASVVLLLGRGRADTSQLGDYGVRIRRFVYFEELQEMVEEELTSNTYGIIIHSAAVSDFRPRRTGAGKISSMTDSLSIDLVPTVKIVDRIRELAPRAFLIKFKLEVGKSEKELLDIGYASLRQSNADLLVANDLDQMKGRHTAYIIDPENRIARVEGKPEIARELLTMIANRTSDSVSSP